MSSFALCPEPTAVIWELFLTRRCVSQAWFLALNPSGTVPVLVVTPEGCESDVVVVGVRAIAAWADAQPQAAAHDAAQGGEHEQAEGAEQQQPTPHVTLLPPTGTPDGATVTALLALHDALDEDDLVFCLSDAAARNLVRSLPIGPLRAGLGVRHIRCL